MTAAPLLVVAAALIDDSNRVMVAKRPLGKAHGGLWEFPGGKVEPGEMPVAALARELQEELGIAIGEASARPISFSISEVEGRTLVLLLFAVERWTGSPAAIEHQAIAWLAPPRLPDLPMPPADHALLPALKRWIMDRQVEARAGIEPACKDLQSSA